MSNSQNNNTVVDYIGGRLNKMGKAAKGQTLEVGKSLALGKAIPNENVRVVVESFHKGWEAGHVAEKPMSLETAAEAGVELVGGAMVISGNPAIMAASILVVAVASIVLDEDGIRDMKQAAQNINEDMAPVSTKIVEGAVSIACDISPTCFVDGLKKIRDAKLAEGQSVEKTSRQTRTR